MEGEVTNACSDCGFCKSIRSSATAQQQLVIQVTANIGWNKVGGVRAQGAGAQRDFSGVFNQAHFGISVNPVPPWDRGGNFQVMSRGMVWATCR